MIEIRETTRTIPYYRPIPLTRLPLLYRDDHLFPYGSYGETESTPTPRVLRIVVLENDFLRVEVAPELGGRVYSLFDKRIGKEILFSNPVIRPVRIRPIWAFISGGIEFNFPIIHTPIAIDEVGCSTGRTGDYGFIRVGERDARTGMEWVVELGLHEESAALVQRTSLRNLTAADQPWTLWTIAAVPSTEGTEYVHPADRVMIHDDRVAFYDWPGEGLNWDRNYQQMTALFWKPGGSAHFGSFHHDLGFGLMHLADSSKMPGKKAWTYGYGRHRGWGEGTTVGGKSYAEIETSPLNDMGATPLFAKGTERHYEEYWIPVHTREACDNVPWPEIDLPPSDEPWLGWKHSAWQSEWEAFRDGRGAHGKPAVPKSFPPTGIELEAALRRELESGNADAAEPLALWLAYHNRPEEALALLIDDPKPEARRLAGLILWKALGDRVSAAPLLQAGPLGDPVALVELDELYTELGMNEQRGPLLASGPENRFVIERRAELALKLGHPDETIRILMETTWPREHQRYIRTDLWKKARLAQGDAEGPVPDSLNEDNQDRVGAAWPKT